MTNEVYRLTLDHFIDNNGDKLRLDDPLVVQCIYDRSYAPPVICLNSMIERMCHEILKLAIERVDE